MMQYAVAHFEKKSYLFDLEPFIKISKNVQGPSFYMNDFQIKKVCELFELYKNLENKS